MILKVVDLLIGLRVGEADETVGLDLSQHGEEGYVPGDNIRPGYVLEPGGAATDFAPALAAEVSLEGVGAD